MMTGVVQGQGQVVDPGPFGHEAEVGDEHRGLVLEERRDSLLFA